MSRIIRIPNGAYDNLLVKKKKMEDVAMKKLKFPVVIPMTKIIGALSERHLIITDDMLIKMGKRVKKNYVRI